MNFFQRSISPPGLKHNYSLHVEQYRGVCAVLVLLAHALGDEKLMSDDFKFPSFVHYLNAGYLSVMVFFCISGYVIGLNYDRIKLNIGDYLKKRAIRLYPVYLFALIMCLVVVGFPQLYVLIGNILFLQNDQFYFNFKIPMFVNYPTWSLNFEVVYYFTFILVFFLQPKVWKMLLFMLAFSIGFIFFPSLKFSFIPSYLNGFYFWMVGLVIAWRIFDTGESKDRRVAFFSILFLHMSQHHLGIGEIILRAAGLHTLTTINWLFDLPFCIMVMCALTGRDNTFLRYNKVLCYVLPGLVFLYLVLHHRLTEDTRWVMCFIYWILSLVFFFERKVSDLVLSKLTGVGKISYGLYIFHVPVAKLIKKWVIIQDVRMEMIVKFGLWVIFTFGLAYLFERSLQPAIKRYFTAQPKQVDTHLLQVPARR